jgi:hypothetical protein
MAIIDKIIVRHNATLAIKNAVVSTIKYNYNPRLRVLLSASRPTSQTMGYSSSHVTLPDGWEVRRHPEEAKGPASGKIQVILTS